MLGENSTNINAAQMLLTAGRGAIKEHDANSLLAKSKPLHICALQLPSRRGDAPAVGSQLLRPTTGEAAKRPASHGEAGRAHDGPSAAGGSMRRRADASARHGFHLVSAAPAVPTFALGCGYGDHAYLAVAKTASDAAPQAAGSGIAAAPGQ